MAVGDLVLCFWLSCEKLFSPPLFILLLCTRKSRLFSLAANEGRELTQKWLLGWFGTLG